MDKNLSNVYIEKVNSEHPLALWTLSEQVDYLSIINESERQFYNPFNWSLINCTAINEPTVPIDTPFKDSALTRIQGYAPTTSTMLINALKVDEISLDVFDADLANFNIGLYVYIDNPYTNKVILGYQFFNTTTLVYEEVLHEQAVSSTDSNKWRFFSHTFPNPAIYMDQIRPIVRFEVSQGGVPGDYDFLLNGLTIGEWSEDFHETSLGVNPQPISSSIALPSFLDVLPAYQYGSSNKVGYYLSHSDRLAAKNLGIPLVYGSSNITKLYPNKIDGTTYPSLIFPGCGFLNKSGKFNEYTAEMWVRVNTDSNNPIRLFGPISNTDGLYIEHGFLILVLDGNYSTHYIGEWMRPMLIHIRYIKNNISVLLNGEQVISFDFIESDLNLPEEYVDGKSQDWLGFYAYENAHPIEVDSFAIYSYSVPIEVAKRRWVWGQAVLAPESTGASTSGVTAFNDYSFSNYAVNYNYPDFAQWSQGFFSNVNTSSNFLTLPDYELPYFNLNGFSTEKWHSDLKTIQTEDRGFYTFRPNSEWSSAKCYAYFKNFVTLQEKVESLYGVFKSNGSAVNETILKIVNRINGDYFLIKINGTVLTYQTGLNNIDYTVATKSVAANTRFSIGINLSNISLKNLNGINRFFADQSALEMYLGGDQDSTFTGEIYTFGMDASYNNRNLESLYDQDGIFIDNEDTLNTLLDHTANYTIKTFDEYNLFLVDLAIAGYWEDYMPLTYFAKYVKDYQGVNHYDLDMLQINLDYPEPLETSSLETTNSWTYGEMKSEYRDPVVLSYSDLSNSFFTTWQDYQDMAEKSNKYFYYETLENPIKVYISFQRISDGANKNLNDFEYFARPRIEGVVNPNTLVDVLDTGEASPGTWENTAYEVTDGTVVYYPKTDLNNKEIDFNDLAIVYHLDIKAEGASKHKVKMRDLQIASQVLERNKFTEIGTRYGATVYPYSRTGIYYNFKANNPFSTYKGSTPYLYLNKHTGWRMRGKFDAAVDRGIALRINPQAAANTVVNAIQMWIRYSDARFSPQGIKIFSIDHQNGIYDFYIKGDESLQRGYIYALDRETSAELNNFIYYINGLPATIPYVTVDEWTVLGIGFPETLVFSDYANGKITINGPLTYNNISYYFATSAERNQQIEVRSWSNVKNDGTARTWNYWSNSKTWNGVYIISINTTFATDPAAIYQKYAGTNRIVIDDSVNGISFTDDRLRVYKDITWSSSTKVAV